MPLQAVAQRNVVYRDQTCPAESMIRLLTGSDITLQPVYSMNGSGVMDGMRARISPYSMPRIGQDRYNSFMLLNAIRYFLVQKQHGYLYLDIHADDLMNNHLVDDLLHALADQHESVALVVMLSGTLSEAVLAVVEELRSAGMVVGMRALAQGDLQLVAVSQLKPECLAMYVSDRAMLPATTVAALIASLPRLTGQQHCPVISDYMDSDGVSV